MEDIPLSILFGILVLLVFLSAFFSSSETGLMSINRYRLRHLAQQGHRSANITEKLLKRPDRLIGLILLGNNLVNILAAQIVTLIALRIGGNYAVAIAGGIFTLVILVFAEVTPKTLAAIKPERVAFPSAWVYWVIEKPARPIVWLINGITNNILKIFRVNASEHSLEALSREELRTVVNEAGAMISRHYRNMLLSVLDMENVAVDEIMVPRHDIQGINLNQPWDDVVDELINSPRTRPLLYEDSIDHVVGILHLRRVMNALINNRLDMDLLRASAREPYFIPEGTPISKQLLGFQANHRRIGLVVDEYGDIQGLVTLEDILEELVGEFTSDSSAAERDAHPQDDGSFIVNATATVRALNRSMKIDLPTDGPRTLSGLIVEHLEDIPQTATSIRIGDYPIEIIQTKDNRIITARVGKKL